MYQYIIKTAHNSVIYPSLVTHMHVYLSCIVVHPPENIWR